MEQIKKKIMVKFSRNVENDWRRFDFGVWDGKRLQMLRD